MKSKRKARKSKAKTLIRNRRVDPMWTPKIKPCQKICDSCPFHPSGKGFANKHREFPSILNAVAIGGDFACHQTTGLMAGIEPMTFGSNGQQQCVGAMKYRQGKLEIPQSVVDYWKEQGFRWIDQRDSENPEK